MREPKQSEPRRLSAGVLILSLLVMAAEWILLVAGLKRDEMIVGALAILAAGLFLHLVYRSEHQRLEIPLRDLLQAWRLPWYILNESLLITWILLKDVAGVQRAGSFYRVCGFKTSKSDPVLIGRRVLATAYTTMAPNSLVLGIDYEQSRMLFHQLQRTPVPKMTQALGAQPGPPSTREAAR